MLHNETSGEMVRYGLSPAERALTQELWRERIVPSVRLQPLVLALREATLPAQVARAVTLYGLAALGTQAGSLAVLDESGRRLEVVATCGLSESLVSDWTRFRVDAAIPVAAAVRRREPVIIESLVEGLSTYPALGSAYTELGNVATVAVPLVVGEYALGAIWGAYAWSRTFTEADHALMRLLSRYCGQALARAFPHPAGGAQVLPARPSPPVARLAEGPAGRES